MPLSPLPPQRLRLLRSTQAQPVLVVVALTLLLVTAYLIYRPGLSGPQLLDDHVYLPQGQVAALTGPDLLQLALSGSHGFRLSRALPNLTFAVTQYWSGPDATSRLKQQNLLFHLTNGLLVFWLVWLLARQPATQPDRTAVPTNPPLDPPTLAAAGFSLAVTTVWLLHPLQVSTVLYISQRYVLLAALFMLAALISYVKGRTMMRTHPLGGTALAVIGTGGFGLLAMISKEIAALLPLLIAAIEWCVFSHATGRRDRQARHVTMLILVAVPLAALALYFGPKIHGMLGWQPGRGFSGLERLMTEAHVLALYLKLYAIPIPGSMSLFHDTFPITRQMDATTWALALGYGTAIVAAFALYRRSPWVALGVLWFFACHLLESTVLALELVFEHRNYLATLGLTLALVGGVWELLRRVQMQRLAVPALAAFALLIGLNTAVRAADWGDMERLLAGEYRREPRSPRVLMGLVNLTSEKGHQAVAIRWLNRLLALDLPDASAELGAMQVYCNRDSVDPALYERAISKLKTGIVSPTTVAHLRHLVEQSLRGHCPALAREQLMLMTEYARISPRLRAPSIACAAADPHMWLLMDAQDWAGANRILRETIYKCAGASPITVQLILVNIMGFGAFTGQAAAAQAMLECLADDADLKRKLDSIYHAYGGFDIDALNGRLHPVRFTWQ